MTTNIEWADMTINPVVGCSKCSPGCDNCYAERFAARLAKNPKTAAKYAGVVDTVGKWTGKTSLAPDGCFADLYNARKAKRVFVGSMGDLFHEDVPQKEITNIICGLSLMPKHRFMLLTKRPERARDMLDGALGTEGFSHIWLGVTACNQDEADQKIPVLLETPASKRFVSIEPMLGPINLGFTRAPTDRDYRGWNGDGPIDYVETTRVDELHWVICGGETGPGARPMHPDWVRSLRDQCQSAGVPFFFKAWGDWVTENQAPEDIVLPGESRIPQGWKGKKYEDSVYRVGKRRAGRLLDGVEHNAFPEARP